MKEKINIARTIWILSIFALLIVILLMVMDYKINYQYSSENFIYFYKCSDKVCTTNTKNNKKKAYSKYECYNICPTYKKTINNDYALLKDDTGYILYNYKLGIKIAEGYDNYVFITDKYIIIEKNKLEGVIDTDNNIIISPEYTKIGYYKNDTLIGYNQESIIAKKEDVYGILNYKDGSLVEEFTHKESEINKLLDIIKTS